ncbi:amidohydrolase-domain-containing protein [Crassisporium funariophilum]|nr:amidohydrolase-domain-containing protein [Crassisporium funariophilum]
MEFHGQAIPGFLHALYEAVFTHPAIDNHAHPLLRVDVRNKLPFEGVISEAEGGGLTEDAIHTIACLRATMQLGRLYDLDKEHQRDWSWEDIKSHRATLDYMDLCNKCFAQSRIACILIDDGLGGVADLAEGYKWHDQFTTNKTRRIVRVEIVAEAILKKLLDPHIASRVLDPEPILEAFVSELRTSLGQSALDEDVVGFKSIVCYRTGMNVAVRSSPTEVVRAITEVFNDYSSSSELRLAHKALNDLVVQVTLDVAGIHKKPVQFHTGLGDSDIMLSLSSPAHLQPIIKAYPDTTFVLLHSSYPYTRDAGYLTAVYRNVYLDFGEVFPFVSKEGQRSIIRQVLELSPTNKIMWSSDGHWWPESYFLGAIQARQALYDVLSELVRSGDVTEREGVRIVENALYHNAERVYFGGRMDR